MPRARTKARKRALDILFESEARGDDPRRVLVQRHHRRLVLQQVVRRVADGALGDRDLVEGVAVHEDEVGTVAVEEGHVPAVDGGGVDLGAGVEGPVDDLPGEHVLQGGAHEGTPLAGLHVLERRDRPQLAVQVEHQAVLQVVRGGHVRASPASLRAASIGWRAPRCGTAVTRRGCAE